MTFVISHGFENLFGEPGNLCEVTVVQSQQPCSAKIGRRVTIALANQQLVNSALYSHGQSKPVFVRVVFETQPTAQRGNEFPTAGFFTEYQSCRMFETHES